MKMYYDKDADKSILLNKTIGIIGFGSQGHAQGQNLRDSGYNVIIAELEGTDNYKLAVELGFKPISAAEAAKKADIVQILLPDEVQPKVYRAEIEQNLEPGNAPCIPGGLASRVRKVSWNGDDDLINLVPQVALCNLLQFPQNEGRNFLGTE